MLYEVITVIAHNLETVPRFYGPVRRGAQYERSLEVVANVKRVSAAASKSGIMLGLGETRAQVEQALRDLREHSVDMRNNFV